jgi:hypothetical protein
VRERGKGNLGQMQPQKFMEKISAQIKNKNG